MPKFKVKVTQYIPESAFVIVEAPSREVLESDLGGVYEAALDSNDVEWFEDEGLAYERGKHTVVGEAGPDQEANVVYLGDGFTEVESED